MQGGEALQHRLLFEAVLVAGRLTAQNRVFTSDHDANVYFWQ